MPEHLRALVVILALAGLIFVLARAPACAAAMHDEDFVRRRNFWFALTLTVFLAHSFWLFIGLAAALIVLFALPAEPNKLALYFFVLFAVPAIDAEIPGLGLVQHLFSIDYLRLLALTILLPAWLALRARSDSEPFGRSNADKLLAAYLVLQLCLQLPHTTLTETLRKGVFYAFVDVFLPYYVASRALRDFAAFRDALMSFVLAALVLAAIAVFELARHWLLYAPLDGALGVNWGLLNYLERGDGLLRAQASTGQPIVLGYVLAVALCLALYLKRLIPPNSFKAALVLLAAGLVAALSRGPWTGAAVMLLAFVATGPQALSRLAKLGAAGLCVVPLLLVSPAGQSVVDYLPFVGTVEAHNITYRELLFEISLGVVLDHPLFGAWDFLELPVMQQLKQGQGIIDVVNTYLGVALAGGLVGLSLFCGFFLVVLYELAAAMRRAGDRGSEAYALGQSLFCALLGILAMIFMTSSIALIPVVYWSIAGLAQAYARAPALSGETNPREPRLVVAG